MSTVEASQSAAGVVWDLGSLFTGTDDPRVEATWAECEARADAFSERFKGRVGDLSGAELAEALGVYGGILVDSSKPGHFASLLFAGDTGDAKLGAFLQEQMERGSGLSVKLMFFELELQGVAEERMAEVLADPAMEEYRHYVGKVRAMGPYSLSETEEVLLEETSNTGVRAWVRLHDELTSNHVFRYLAPGSDEVEELSMEEVLDKLRESDRGVRLAAADAFTVGLEEMNRVLTFAYNTILADKKLDDRLRGLEYPERRRHLANELDKETVDLVMRLCRERSDVVARYYRVKREILGLAELTHVDRYAPLFETSAAVGWEEARGMVLESFGAFHPRLEGAAREFFDNRWIDAEVRKGKTGGAFCSYVTPDTHPVMLMSYLGKLNDVGTLAHELGHCVHARLSQGQNVFNYQGTLPLAELASIFGEILVFEKVVAGASLDDQLALYADKIEGIFASVHRQAAMFRFEQRCHTKRREEGEISAEDFGEIWQEELQSMFQDSVVLGEQHRVWWSYVGHFFFLPFYVYAYSFGELLTLSLYDKARVEGAGFAEKYVDVLSRGGSETPLELMGRLGVDLRSEAFWQGGFAVIDRMVGDFERLVGEWRSGGG